MVPAAPTVSVLQTLAMEPVRKDSLVKLMLLLLMLEEFVLYHKFWQFNPIYNLSIKHCFCPAMEHARKDSLVKLMLQLPMLEEFVLPHKFYHFNPISVFHKLLVNKSDFQQCVLIYLQLLMLEEFVLSLKFYNFNPISVFQPIYNLSIKQILLYAILYLWKL